MKQYDTGFYQTPNALLLEYGKQIGVNGIAVYSALLAHDFGNDQCWPSQGRIAELIGCDRKTVNRTIAKLVDAKLVEVVPRKTDQGQRSNLYRPLLKVVQGKQRRPKPVAGPTKHQFEPAGKANTYDLDW